MSKNKTIALTKFEDLAKAISQYGSVTLSQARACILVALSPKLGLCNVIPGFKSQTKLWRHLDNIVNTIKDFPGFLELKKLAVV
ncbi:MAG: hypothetical protein LBT86_03860 [Deltaproteobacteria bacterium]|jgi:hypothetical protein|nr:hypothetical protein [Deltaproteobacteria bacterium]